jgi:hypothetical protein
MVRNFLISVVLSLVWAFDGDVDITSLGFGELGELGAKTIEMEAGNFFIEMLGQHVDTNLVVVLPEGNLGKGLVGEAVGHHKAGMACGASKVDKTALGKENNCVSSRESVLVDLGLDVLVDDAGVVLQTRHVDFVVEMTDVADNGEVTHLGHMFDSDDVAVTGGGDEDLGDGESILKSGDLEASHASLEGTDGINFGNDDTSSLSFEGFGASFSDVSISADN